MAQFELYLDDLTSEARDRYLEFAGQDLNESLPIATLELEWEAEPTSGVEQGYPWVPWREGDGVPHCDTQCKLFGRYPQFPCNPKGGCEAIGGGSGRLYFQPKARDK